MAPQTHTAGEMLEKFENGYGRFHLYGDEGGKVRVQEVWRSDRMFGYVILSTEFGLIYASPDTPLLVT